jgi:hypothetical protein
VAALPAVVLVAAAYAAWPTLTAGARQVTHPHVRDQGRAMLRDVASQLRPDDAVIYYRYSSQLGHFYGPVTGVPHRWEGQLVPARPGGACDPRDLGTALAGARRVWWVHGTLIMAHPREYNRWVSDALSRYGRVVQSRSFGPTGIGRGLTKQAGWILVELGDGARPTPPTPPDPRFRCFEVRPRQP